MDQKKEEVSEKFAKDTYTAELTAKSPADLRKMIDLLLKEECVWNTSSISYSKSGKKQNVTNFNFELY